MEDSEREAPVSPATDSDWGVAPEGHRLPAETRLGPITLQVADLDRSLKYYENVLGLRTIHRDVGMATLAAHGSDRKLIMLRERAGVAPVPPRGRLGLFHFAILLPARGDLGRFLRHLSDVNVHPGASDHHVSEALYLRDPDGLGIEVYADRPRSEWESDGRELRLETSPMNTEAVLRADGDEPWRGMPTGTVMGHVHLHVGDLGEADAFYHEALGFDRMTWSYPGALFLGAGGYHHHLGLNTWGAAGAVPAGDGDSKLLEWSIEVPEADDVAAIAASLEAAGYTAERVAPDEIHARDPWGTQLRVRVASRLYQKG